jgi:hypothetical protein
MRVDRGFALSDAILAQAKDKPHKAIPLLRRRLAAPSSPVRGVSRLV